MSEGKRYLWYSDTHLNLAWPWARRKFVHQVRTDRPDGLFLTGDISSGRCIRKDLEFLATHIDCDIFFVLGNHDYHMRSIDSVHDDIDELCSKYKNLRWMTREGVIPLSEDVALVGTEGWYDAVFGDPKFLRYTLDWLLTTDFWHRSLEERVVYWRSMAEESANRIRGLLSQTLGFKETYVMTHFPPWPEADRAHGSFLERFWLPYNSNHAMGQMIEEVARTNRKHRFTILSGHTHSECTIRVRKNIECRVAPAKYAGGPRREDVFII